MLVVYTDGVSEAENMAGEQFGMKRLSALVARERSRSASEIHSSIRAELDEDVIESLPFFLEEVYNRKRLHSSIGYVPPTHGRYRGAPYLYPQ